NLAGDPAHRYSLRFGLPLCTVNGHHRLQPPAPQDLVESTLRRCHVRLGVGYDPVLLDCLRSPFCLDRYTHRNAKFVAGRTGIIPGPRRTTMGLARLRRLLCEAYHGNANVDPL